MAKTGAERGREYRARQKAKLSELKVEKIKKRAMTSTERARLYRKRKKSGFTNDERILPEKHFEMSPSQAEKLIAQMRPRPALWDLRNRNYNNRPLCDREWSDMAAALNIEKEVVKAKWKSLRDTYRRELRKAKLGQEIKWVHYSKLSFLKDTVEARDRRRAAADTTTSDDQSPMNKWSKKDEESFVNSPYLSSIRDMPYHAAALAKVSHCKEEESEEFEDVQQANVQREEENFPIIKEEPDVELTVDDVSIKEYGEQSTTQSWMDDNDNLADNPRKMFLLSLLPDLNQMTEQQMRFFKISVLQLTCQILDSKDVKFPIEK